MLSLHKRGSWDLVTRAMNQVAMVTIKILMTPVRVTTSLTKSPEPPSRV